MRRISVFLSAAALSFAGVIASAQTGSPAPGPRPNIVSRAVRLSLQGIALTDAEKASLASVSARYTPRFKSIADSTRPAMAALRAARAARDTAAVRAARRNVLALRRSGVATLRTSLVDVRAALTTAHQTQFDANVPRVRRLLRQHARQVPPS